MINHLSSPVAGRSLLVGVRPSQMLTFTPLISTADAGRSWSTGLISQGLASRPTALAVSPGRGGLALVNGRGGPEVLESTRNLSSWQTLVTGHALATTPIGRACGPGPVTAVGYVPATTSGGASVSTVLTVWQLATGATSWGKSQVVHVAIQFGSSS